MDASLSALPIDPLYQTAFSIKWLSWMWDCVIIDSNSIIHYAWEWETLTAVAFRVQPRNIAFMAVLYIDFVFKHNVLCTPLQRTHYWSRLDILKAQISWFCSKSQNKASKAFYCYNVYF